MHLQIICPLHFASKVILCADSQGMGMQEACMPCKLLDVQVLKMAAENYFDKLVLITRPSSIYWWEIFLVLQLDFHRSVLIGLWWTLVGDNYLGWKISSIFFLSVDKWVLYRLNYSPSLPCLWLNMNVFQYISNDCLKILTFSSRSLLLAHLLLILVVRVAFSCWNSAFLHPQGR